MTASLSISPCTLLNDGSHSATAMFWRSGITKLRSSLSVCHFAIGWTRASLSGGHFSISWAILLSFVRNLRRMARRIAIAILCANDVGQSQSRVEAAGQIHLENYHPRSSTQFSSIGN